MREIGRIVLMDLETHPETRVAVASIPQRTRGSLVFERLWHAALMASALIVTVAWISLLGYGLVTLAELAL